MFRFFTPASALVLLCLMACTHIRPGAAVRGAFQSDTLCSDIRLSKDSSLLWQRATAQNEVAATAAALAESAARNKLAVSAEESLHEAIRIMQDSLKLSDAQSSQMLSQGSAFLAKKLLEATIRCAESEKFQSQYRHAAIAAIPKAALISELTAHTLAGTALSHQARDLFAERLTSLLQTDTHEH